MEEINPIVAQWFDRGLIKEALVGDENFYIDDYYWRGKHDRNLIMTVLFLWANQRQKVEQVGEELANIILDLLQTRTEIGLDILLTYTISLQGAKNQVLKNPNKHLIKDLEPFQNAVMEILEKKYSEGVLKDIPITMLKEMSKLLPKLARIINKLEKESSKS